MQVAPYYPADAIGGADFLDAAAQRDITVDPNVSVADGGTRKERVVITDKYLEHEGRVCISETSVRHMANLLGMYEGERVVKIVGENDALRGEITALQAQCALYQERLALEGNQVTVFVGADGEGYATKAGAAAANAPRVDALKIVETNGDGGEAGGESSPPEDGKTTPSAKPAAKKGDDLDELTVEGLHDVASELEIEGRSSMNRADLVKAIRKARK